MTNEHMPTWLLEAGDVIRVRHQHDSQCGVCLAPWETEAVVTARPAAVSGRVVVNWAAVSRLPGGQARATGVSVFSPDEQVLRTGRLAPGRHIGLSPSLARAAELLHSRVAVSMPAIPRTC